MYTPILLLSARGMHNRHFHLNEPQFVHQGVCIGVYCNCQTIMHIIYIMHEQITKELVYALGTGSSLTTVLESLGMPVTGSQSMLKGYHNSLIDGSPSILVSPMG